MKYWWVLMTFIFSASLGIRISLKCFTNSETIYNTITQHCFGMRIGVSCCRQSCIHCKSQGENCCFLKKVFNHYTIIMSNNVSSKFYWILLIFEWKLLTSKQELWRFNYNFYTLLCSSISEIDVPCKRELLIVFNRF